MVRLYGNLRDKNYLKAYTFTQPERIPIRFLINYACLNYYDLKALERLVVNHKLLFPHYVEGSLSPQKISPNPWQFKDREYTDNWGSVWKTTLDGITGAVIKFPLAEWNAFQDYCPPDPEISNGWEFVNWQDVRAYVEADKQEIGFATGELRHGFFFLTLEYLRGYQNLVYDMYDERPELDELIAMVENFNARLIEKYLELDVELMMFPEDFGTQKGPMISPHLFQKYIKPSYKRLMAPVKAKNTIIHMHNDGHIMDLIDDFIECGIDVINLQDRVNGIDMIAKEIKGRIAIDIDIDRQEVTRFGTPADIDGLIREDVMKLGSKEGGFSMVYDLYPRVPLENAEAVMDAMEKYTFYFS